MKPTFILNVLAVIFCCVTGGRAFGGTWTPVATLAPDFIDTMLLLSDGTVMCANGDNGWYRLTPNSSGSYVNGSWSTLASMNHTRLYYSSDVLTNGRVFIAGAEYGTGTNSAEIYDPVANTWTFTPPPPAGQSLFYDSSSVVLPNGNVLISPVGPATYGGTVIYNTAANTLTAGPTLFRGYYQDEASWVKLPDDSILTIDPFGVNSERFIPSQNRWINDANVPVSIYDPFGGEMGAGLLLPDGRAFYIGATGNTAFYTPTGSTNAGSWSAGPVIPNGQAAPDAPAAMMMNGKVLCALSPLPVSTNHFPSPTSFYEFDPVANTFTQISGPTGLTYNAPPFIMRMLDLPDGNVLLSVSGQRLYVYQPGGTPLAAGRPTINSITGNLDGTYTLTGTLLNGISQGAAYGDDAQMDSNYPLLRMTNIASGLVYYARTFNWNSTSVMTSNRVVTTLFSLPAGLPQGNYNVVAVANGIASAPYAFSTLTVSLSLFLPASVPENGGVQANAGTVVLASPLATNLTVTLTSSVPSRLTVPASVTLLAGQTQTNFNLLPVDNALHDGDQSLTITANAPGITTAFATTLVTDDDLPPTITGQPVNQAAAIGGSAAFTVSATGKSPLNYFWKRDGTPIANATNATYTLVNAQPTDSGAQFTCLVTNAFGSTNSTAAVLTVGQLEIVTNGGFETGDFTGWSLSGNTGYTTVDGGHVHSGTFGVSAGPFGALGFLSQTLTTIPGQSYILSFWFKNDLGGDLSNPQIFQASWNGGLLYSVTNPPALDWTNFVFHVAATGSSTVLQFGWENDPDYFGLDDVSVQLVLPAVLTVTPQGNGVLQFSWNPQSGLQYQLQCKTNLTQNGWINLGSAVSAPPLTVTNTPGSPQNFYRLQLLP